MFQFNVQFNPRLDPIDDLILQGIQDQKSLVELAAENNRSFAGIRKRMKALEAEGYIVYPEGKARSRMLTPKATEYMKVNGLLKTEPIFTK